MKEKSKAIRCAIYTRKSSEEGLDQDYNSLHAQRDACAAYVLSQAGEGWTLLPEIYDDGGFSGGTMDRPALKQLLKEIDAGKIDVVIVYKVDRLTRSLTDFSRIVDVLDRSGASFVSVTQAFNTTSSMGRLTLNVLLSFAQFEREVTGERIRDKITASKKLGMWMGGNLALGYLPNGRTLTIEPHEAETVRMIFRRYLELGSVHALRRELEDAGVLSKQWTSKGGSMRGGVPFNRGALFHLLRNRLYLGEVPHKDVSYPGQHAAIVDRELFDAVQARLDETAHKPRTPTPAHVRRAHKGAPLTGLIFDTAGHLMSPVSCPRRNGATYRYYVSRAIQSGAPEKAGACPRVPAPVIEDLIFDRLRRLGRTGAGDAQPDWTDLRPSIQRVEIAPEGLTLTLNASSAEAVGGLDWARERLPVDDDLQLIDEALILKIPVWLVRRGGASVAVGPDGATALQHGGVDAALSSALVRAEAWKRQLLSGEAVSVGSIATAEGLNAYYASRLLRVAFLAPDLKRAILEGRQPAAMNLQAIMTRDLPLAWDAQRALFRG